MPRYRDDPEWADVPKIPLNEGPNPVVRIRYSERFTDIMDCFRGVLRTNEYSERTLKLTQDVLDTDPANYTAWVFRRKALKALNADLEEELEFTEEMAIKHPENDEIWHHRREICAMAQDGSKEKAFCERMISHDAKNYHAWSHRRWAVRTFEMWDGELEYTARLLDADVRNNSAWSFRSFVMKTTTPMDVKDRQREIDYALGKIAIAPHNQSVWSYVRGMMRGQESHFADMLISKCTAVLEENATCIFAAALLVDVYATQATEASIATALELVDQLENDIDLPHAHYWKFKRTTLKVKE